MKIYMKGDLSGSTNINDLSKHRCITGPERCTGLGFEVNL